MFWVIALAVVAIVLVVAARYVRPRAMTDHEREQRRRRFGIHDGNGNSFGERF